MAVCPLTNSHVQEDFVNRMHQCIGSSLYLELKRQLPRLTIYVPKFIQRTLVS